MTAASGPTTMGEFSGPSGSSLISSVAPAEPSVKPSRAEALLTAFTAFRQELDAHQAQRERVVKLSRDGTALSKQLIFTLHRVGSGKGKAAVFTEAEAKMDGLRVLFAKLQGEVRGADFWRYERSVSPGIQEYLEGLTFYHYLEHHSLPTLEEVQASLFPPSPAPPAQPSGATISSDPATSSDQAADPTGVKLEPYFHVSIDDYLGGVADLTGELMRLAIASVGKNLSASLAPGDGSNPRSTAQDAAASTDIHQIARLVREIQSEMTPLADYARWLPKKLHVLDQSLAKIENASYNLRIRGAEYKDSPAMLQMLARRETDSGPMMPDGRDDL